MWYYNNNNIRDARRLAFVRTKKYLINNQVPHLFGYVFVQSPPSCVCFREPFNYDYCCCSFLHSVLTSIRCWRVLGLDGEYQHFISTLFPLRLIGDLGLTSFFFFFSRVLNIHKIQTRGFSEAATPVLGHFLAGFMSKRASQTLAQGFPGFNRRMDLWDEIRF